MVGILLKSTQVPVALPLSSGNRVRVSYLYHFGNNIFDFKNGGTKITSFAFYNKIYKEQRIFHIY